MSVAGAWKTTINAPMGLQEGTLAIKPQGEVFTGQMTGELGAVHEISGRVNGETLIWVSHLTQPYPVSLAFHVTVDGDEMTGSVKAGASGASPLRGVRA
jgi:hypothetical protein